MIKNTQYKQELAVAQENLDELRERGDEALGEDVIEFMNGLLTPEEIAASQLRVRLMLELTQARHECGLSQRALEELSGVKQPVIARMEMGSTKPQLDTFLKVLAPLGKTLYIGDIAR